MDELEKLKRNAAFLDEIENEDGQPEIESETTHSKIQPDNIFFSPAQKLFISLLIFLFILVVGLFIMLTTGKMFLPV